VLVIDATRFPEFCTLLLSHLEARETLVSRLAKIAVARDIVFLRLSYFLALVGHKVDSEVRILLV
jgi:hypothetical protein